MWVWNSKVSSLHGAADSYAKNETQKMWKMEYDITEVKPGQTPSSCFRLSGNFCLMEGEVESLVNPCWSAADRRLVHVTWRGASAHLDPLLSHTAVALFNKYLPSSSSQLWGREKDLAHKNNKKVFYSTKILLLLLLLLIIIMSSVMNIDFNTIFNSNFQVKIPVFLFPDCWPIWIVYMFM